MAPGTSEFSFLAFPTTQGRDGRGIEGSSKIELLRYAIRGYAIGSQPMGAYSWTMLTRISSITVLLSVLMLSTVSLAQETVDEAAESEARIHFNLAQRYYDTGRFAEAALEFRAAYELTRLADLLYNAFLAYREAGDYEHAVEALEDFLPQVTDPVRRRGYQARLVRMRELVANQAETSSDTEEPESAEGESEPTEPEPDELEVSADGDPASNSQNDLIEPLPSPVEASGTVAPWIIFGVGSAMVVGGAVTGVLALSTQSDLDAMCDESGCRSGYENVQSEGATLATTTDILLIGGLTVASVGLIWALLSGEIDDTDLDVQASCTSTGCRTLMAGTF